MSFLLPKEGNVAQKETREVVEACLKKRFWFKLARGLILRHVRVDVEEA